MWGVRKRRVMKGSFKMVMQIRYRDESGTILIRLLKRWEWNFFYLDTTSGTKVRYTLLPF